MSVVNAELTVLSGSIAGTVHSLRKGETVLGRSPEADLVFDPREEITISGAHAALYRTELGWVVKDLKSLNGTFVNGERVSDPVVLADRDRIQLGPEGPILEFRLRTGPPGAERREGPGAADPGTGRRNGRFWAALGLLVLVLSGVTWMAVHSWSEGRRYRAQTQAMQERIDSILDASAATAGALEGRIQGLHEALADSREALQSVRADLEEAQRGGDSEEIAGLRVQLQQAQAALVRQQLAATLDHEAIEAANRRAVAKVFVDFGGNMVTATAFAVRPDGTLLTSRHVVEGQGGSQRPRRVAVQFADSRQVWPARVLSTSPSDDLAILKVDNIMGEVPTVTGLHRRPDTIQTGQGLAIIGFPLGGPASGSDGTAEIARTTLTAGIVSASADDLLEVYGYGVEGSSGSPIFDANGQVVGVLFGGRIEDGERILFAVPANRAAVFLDLVL